MDSSVEFAARFFWMIFEMEIEREFFFHRCFSVRCRDGDEAFRATPAIPARRIPLADR